MKAAIKGIVVGTRKARSLCVYNKTDVNLNKKKKLLQKQELLQIFYSGNTVGPAVGRQLQNDFK